MPEQLIPGHEAIGTVVEMGKDVKGFDMGDRCVADVGETVSLFLHTLRSVQSSDIMIGSARTASTAAVARNSCARTSPHEVSPLTVASPSTSSSAYTPSAHGL